ncbi:RAMP superfamily CRISPR-associated protein [Millisia brevis]|uniref:RAMP superfamily CRISPR-associated protein n=1 Tax=Millisia brevis TaxID=264148 RepID=UPI0008332234|nr:RAMP superfamily CRISPR-associated protein [Millisia brevis]
MSIELNVTVAFLSDWRVSTGYSRSTRVDTAVVTDPHTGLPYLPAKSLTGVLRHRAEQLADALDGTAGGEWHTWLEYVFGSQPADDSGRGRSRAVPVPAALITAPLRLSTEPANLAQSGSGLLTGTEIARAATIVRAGVRIDRTTGTAMGDHVRFEERARAGVSVSAVWAVDADAEADLWPARFLLGAAARLVRSVGGGRRRGAGECVVTFAEIDESHLDTLLERIEAEEALPVPPPRRVDSSHTAAGDGESVGGATELVHAHDLVVQIVEPTIVGALTTANLVESALAIPGSVLLPLVLRELGSNDLVRNGHIVVTEATPDIDGRRTFPWPLALTEHKMTKDARNLCVPHIGDPKLGALMGNYVAADDDGVVRFTKPALVQRLHAVVDDDDQGPDNLFVTDALAPGTVFRAQVWLPAGKTLPNTAFRAGDLRIGRSSKDDYGSIDVTVETPISSPPAETIPAGREFGVLLASHVILLRDDGGPDVSVVGLARALEGLLGGITLEPVRSDFTGDRIRFGCVVRTVRIDSWQARWGLPRPSLEGLAAGSTIYFTADREILPDEQRRFESTPIGLRTVEGFGRILINPDVLPDEPKLAKAGTRGNGAAGPVAVPAVDSVGRRLIETAAMARIESAAVLAVRGAVDRYLPRGVDRTQLYVLRTLVDGFDADGGLQRFRAWRHTKVKGDPWAKVKPELAALLDPQDSTVRNPVWSALFPNTPDRDLEVLRSVSDIRAVQVLLRIAIGQAAKTLEGGRR